MEYFNVQPVHPIIYEFQEAGFSKIIILFFAACVIAPLAEESIFRGAFYHYLRTRHGVFFSVLVTGLIFAAVHPQGITALPVLCAIGVNLALIREWRGSLIASITAHSLNNGMVTMLVVFMFR